MKRLLFITLLLGALAVALPATAQDEPTLDDVLGGFEEEDPKFDVTEAQPQRTEEPSPLELTGSVALKTSYNYAHDEPASGETDWRGLQKLRAEIDLALEYDISASWRARVSGLGYYDHAYTLNGRDEYTDEVLDEYENEAELKDAYVQGSLLESLDIKEGRQVVVWGTSDNIRVTDVINPIDLREPGLVDIEDMRLPLLMTRLDYYTGPPSARWNLTVIAVHENRTDKTPPWGSDFYPADRPPPDEEDPDGPEYAASLTGRFTGWDAALYWADVYENLPHVERRDIGSRVRRYSRVTMYGAALSAAAGNWLLKAEAAHFEGLEFFNDPDKEYSRTDVLAGVEYSGLTETTISLEAVNHHINAYDALLGEDPDGAEEDSFQWALRISRDFLHDTLNLTIVTLVFGVDGDNGSMERYSAEYDITDALKVRGGILAYQSGGSGALADAGENDRAFLEFLYHF